MVTAWVFSAAAYCWVVLYAAYCRVVLYACRDFDHEVRVYLGNLNICDFREER
jgi:hypothetical protein